jgi:DNA replication protein DnaC
MKATAEFFSAQGATKEAKCDKHGEFQSRHVIAKVWSACPQCTAESFETEKRLQEVRAREERTRAWEKRVGQAGIPERFRDRSLKSFAATTDGQQNALAVCAKYANEFDQATKRGSCILMCGKPGTGKTHLAVGIGLHVMDRFHSTVLFTTVLRATRSVKETYGKHSEQTESKAIAELVFPDLLILDEVGVQHGSDTEKLILFDILNERYEKRKPTIFLTNKDLDGFKAYVGERIYDRLREDGCEYISFTWDSYRGKTA